MFVTLSTTDKYRAEEPRYLWYCGTKKYREGDWYRGTAQHYRGEEGWDTGDGKARKCIIYSAPELQPPPPPPPLRRRTSKVICRLLCGSRAATQRRDTICHHQDCVPDAVSGSTEAVLQAVRLTVRRRLCPGFGLLNARSTRRSLLAGAAGLLAAAALHAPASPWPRSAVLSCHN